MMLQFHTYGIKVPQLENAMSYLMEIEFE